MSRHRHEERFLRDLQQAAERRRRHPLDEVWTWRREAVALVAWGGAGWWTVRAGGPLVAGAVLVLLVGGVVVPRPARDRASGYVRLAICEHRIRRACWEAGVHSRSGRRPLGVSARLTRRGERLRFWCPAGVAAADLSGASELVAAACFASRVEIRPVPGRADLVTVEVVRRQDEAT